MKVFGITVEPPQGKHSEVIESGRFTVLLPEVFGFCGGVISALKKLEKTINNASLKAGVPPPEIYLLGEIIHNSTVNQIISSAGVKIIPESKIESIFEVAKKSDYIVIPAFGVPLDIERKIRSQYENVVDTTCKNVKSLWKFVSEEAKKKSTILLYAKPGHPEVNATISRANSNCVIILESLDSAKYFVDILKRNPSLETSFCKTAKLKQNSFIADKTSGVAEVRNSPGGIKNLDYLQSKGIFIYNYNNFNPKRFALANQTTMLFSETMEVENIIRTAIDPINTTLTTCNTLCNATYLRQQAALAVCRQKPDIIIVVGGYDSSNTANLFKLAQGFADTYYIKDSDSINSSVITHFIPKMSKEVKTPTELALNGKSKIVILAGASCPFILITQIIKKLGNI